MRGKREELALTGVRLQAAAYRGAPEGSRAACHRMARTNGCGQPAFEGTGEGILRLGDRRCQLVALV